MACPVAYTTPKESYSKKKQRFTESKATPDPWKLSEIKKIQKDNKEQAIWNNILTMIYKISRNSKAIKAILTNVFKIPEIFT